MTAKEYLSQAYMLQSRIDKLTKDIEVLTEMTRSISAVCNDADRVQTSKNTDAPFVKGIERLEEMRERLTENLNLYVALKDQMEMVIGSIPDVNAQMVIRHRYLERERWENIGDHMGVCRTTVYRWAVRALENLVLPENPIKI